MHAFSMVFKINKCMNGFANTFLLTCHKCHIKTFTREGETRERHAKKVKRQESYKYTFIIIISTGCNIKTMSKLLQNYLRVLVTLMHKLLFRMYTLNGKIYVMIYNSKVTYSFN